MLCCTAGIPTTAAKKAQPLGVGIAQPYFPHALISAAVAAICDIVKGCTKAKASRAVLRTQAYALQQPLDAIVGEALERWLLEDLVHHNLTVELYPDCCIAS